MVLWKARWDSVTGITPQLVLSWSATLHRKPNVLDRWCAHVHTARTKANASPKHPNIQSSVVSQWRYTYNKISTLLQAELVLQNAAASHYFFTYLDFSSNVQELLSKPLTAKTLFWRDPLDHCSSYIFNLLNYWRSLPDSTYSHCSNC